MTVFLIGTRHRLQHDGESRAHENGDKLREVRQAFKNYLSDVIREKSISLVAEEYCESLLPHVKARSTISKLAAKETEKTHIYCDPDMQKRNELGVPFQYYDYPVDDKKKYDAVREKFWLEQIQGHLHEEILFVLGAVHVSAFKRLLNEQGVNVEVLFEHWGKEHHDL